ncbi:MAG: hypothetical protein IJW20_06670 [Clostridia bacterium]|nr:hypothetical protein [Clostridia bacterium]
MLSNCDMLLNKFKMASLNELLKRFNDVNERLAGHETRLTDAKAKLKECNDIIEQQELIIEELEGYINDTQEILNSGKKYTESTIAAAKKSIEELNGKKEAAQKIIEEQKRLREGPLAIEGEIKADQQELDSIMVQFAADLVINKHLQDEIEIKYAEEISKQDEKIDGLNSKKDEIVKGLVNDSELKEKIVKLKELNKEYISVRKAPIFSDENQEKLTNLINSVKVSKEELKNAIEAKYQIKLTDRDVTKIVTTEEGKSYTIPSIDEEIKGAQDTKKSIAVREKEEKAKIKGALSRKVEPILRKQQLEGLIKTENNIVESSTQEIEDLSRKIREIETQLSVDTTAEEKDFNAKNQAFTEAEQAEKAKTEEIEGLDNEIENLDTQMSGLISEEEKTKLAELEGKIPADLLKRKNELIEEIKNLNEEGSEDITKETFNEFIKTDSNKELWNNFKKADVALREAFVNCQTCQPEDLEDAKIKLAAAIQKYKESSQALADASGFNVKQLHNYLLKAKNNMLVNGKDVEDVYFAENMQNKLDVIKNTYPDAFKEDGAAVTKFNNLADSSKEIMDLQEKVLSGEDVELGHITGKVDNYRNVMEGLFEKLKTKGFSSLESVKDLFGIISGKLKIQGKFNLFKWIGNLGRNLFGKGNKNTISGYKENTKVSEKSRKQKELRDVEKAIDENFDEGELNELKALREKKEQYDSLKQQRDAKSEKRNAKAGELVELTNKKNVAENAMKDAKKVLEDAKNKSGKATPEQESELKELKAQKARAESRKRAAETRRRTYEYENEDLGVIRDSKLINGHASESEYMGYKKMTAEALRRIEENADEERE